MTTDYRALVSELVDSVEVLLEMRQCARPMRITEDRLNRARAALAEPEPQTPTDEELLAMRSWSSHGPTFDSDLVDFGRRCYNLADRARAALAKPEPPPDGEVVELCCALRDKWLSLRMDQRNRAADLLERLAVPGVMGPTNEELIKTYCDARRAFYFEDAEGKSDQEDRKAATIHGLRAVLARWGRPTIKPILSPGYERGDGSMDGAQMVEGEWWHPVWGCDSLSHVIDQANYLLSKNK